MKTLYKIVLFFAIFQVVVLMVNSLGVFPNTLYSDVDTTDLFNDDGSITAQGIVAFLFPQITTSEGSEDFTFSLVAAGFTSIGMIIAIGISAATRSLAPIVIGFISLSIVPMVLTSWSFFRKMFYNWDTSAMVYLSIAIGVGILILAVITILETPTHGDV